MDINLYVEADPDLEELAAAEALFEARFPHTDEHEQRRHLEVVAAGKLPPVSVPIVYVNSEPCHSRYFGEEQWRGDWPFIESVISTLVEAFPGARVHYGPDDHNDAALVSPERIQALREDWARCVEYRDLGCPSGHPEGPSRREWPRG